MKDCKLTITTSTDGRETKTIRKGKIELLEEKILLLYREENATVNILLEGNVAKVERVGDYALSLRLESGETCEGSIGLGGSSGGVLTRTHRVAYSVREGSLLVSLRYDLLFGTDAQRMQLRIRAEF